MVAAVGYNPTFKIPPRRSKTPAKEMATPACKPCLSIPEGDIPKGYVIYGDQLVLASFFNALRLGRRNSDASASSLDINQRVSNLQLDVFSGDMENADIAGWVRHTETRLRVCRVPEPMWVATATGHLLGPTQAWFTTWAAEKTDIVWEEFVEAAKQRYSGAFAPIVVGTPCLQSNRPEP